MSLRFRLSDAGTVVDALVALNAQVLPGMGPRDHVAWVMNVLAHVTGPRLVEIDCQGRSLAAIDASHVDLAAHLAPEGYLTMEVSAAEPPPGRLSPPAAAFALARILAPAVNALAYAGPLAPRALWRIAGDGLAWGWATGDEVARGEEILRAYGAPFANRQLVLGDRSIARRGGCCRYLSVSGTACANCPLKRSAAERRRPQGSAPRTTG